MKDDMISRQAAIDALCDEYCGGWQDCKHYPKCENLKAIQNLPSTQPEIIHCKDCKYSEHSYRNRRRCFLWSEDEVSVFDDGYCNYAERKTNG